LIDPQGSFEAPPVHPGPGFPLASLRYFVWLYSPADQKRVVQSLLGLEREIAGTQRAVTEHQVVHVRLEWWRAESERLAAGNPIHPLTRALTEEANKLQLPSVPADISGFVDVATWDLAGATFETQREVSAYCERWSAAMFGTIAAFAAPGAASTPASRSARAPGSVPAAGSETAAGSAGAADSAAVASSVSPAGSADRAGSAQDAARALGAAVRDIEFLAELARDAHAGRVRLPLDELERVGADPRSLAKPPWADAVAVLIREQARALRASVTAGLDELRRGEPERVRGIYVWGGLALRLARRIERALPGPVMPGRADTLAESWQAWRAARSARR
jgi:15-cis-phytoene synthase